MKVLGYSVEIDYSSTHDEMEAFGKYLPLQLKIKIANDLCAQQKQSTLLHEIFEVINSIMKLGLDEQAIMILEASFYQILTENGIDLSKLGKLE